MHIIFLISNQFINNFTYNEQYAYTIKHDNICKCISDIKRYTNKMYLNFNIFSNLLLVFYNNRM